jgi:hypothetical protein
MRHDLFILVLCMGGGVAIAAPPLPPPHVLPAPLPITVAGSVPTQFMTTVQFAVQEKTAHLTQRGQRLVIDQFSDVFESSPEFEGRRFEVKTNGPEVVFYVTAPNDIRQFMERAVTQVLPKLQDRVRIQGRLQFYRTSLEQSQGGILEVRTDDTHSKIVSVSAQSVPLRDILKEIKAQVGGLSYLIPGECAEQLVDWSFGEGDQVEPKTLEAAMREIGALFKLNLVKQNNTYVFNGVCDATNFPKTHVRKPDPAATQANLWRDLPSGNARGVHPTAVFFSVPSISR